jgi:hypothetical protein
LTVLCTQPSDRDADELCAAVERTSPFEAELALVHLTERLGLEVESVTRAGIGPFWQKGGRLPALIEPLVKDGGFVLSCASEQAGIELPASGSNDPFAGLFEDELSGEARETYQAVQDRLGYRVYRDRKFVVSPGLEEPLGALCARLGKRCVIYSV